MIFQLAMLVFGSVDFLLQVAAPLALLMTAPRETGAFLREAPLDRTTAEPMEVEEDCCLVVFGGLICKGTAEVILHRYMGVSKNRSTPKSSILIGFSIINHPFPGTPIFGNTHILYIYTIFIYIYI